MKITFCLRDPKTANPTPIHAYIHFGNQQLKIATGCSVVPKLWNQNRRRVKRGATDEALVNAALAKMESDIGDIITDLKSQRIEPTKELVRDRYAELSGRAAARAGAKVDDLYTVLDTFMKDSSALLRPRTIQIYKTVKNQLEAFSKDYGVELSWDTLNLLFFQKFTEYLVRVQGLNNATLDKTLQRLRAFLRHCDEVRGIPMCRDYLKFTKKALPKGEQSRKIYLNKGELQRIEALELETNDRLLKVRDTFLFLAHTGLRFGDSQSLKPENFKVDCLELTTGKNRRAIRIPTHPAAERIWRRYEGQLPQISNQKFNAYLKEICKLAEIEEPCQVVDFSGSQRRERTVPKWKLVGAHTAKRSFVTNLLISGVSLETVCEITGNTMKSIQKYVVLTGDDVRREVAASWERDVESANAVTA